MRLLITTPLVAVLVGLAGHASARPWRAALAPGDVAKEHQKVEGDCDRCHLSFKGVPNDKCLSCHGEIGARIDAQKGFHAGVRKEACILCHTDHRGGSGPVTKKTALEKFDHKDTGFALTGAHQKLQCQKCHDKKLDALSSSCAGCHADPHKGTLGASCRSCHRSDDSWKQGLKPLAEHKVRTDGGHAKLACGSCHAGGAHLVQRAACADCHEQGHGGTKAACDVCHTVEGWKKDVKFEHDTCTCVFPGKHQSFPCLSCHQGWKFTGTPKLCSGCHAKELKHEPLGECSLCHSALSWKKKDRFDHNRRSSFKIEAAHLTVDCSQCHPKEGQFRGAPKECQGCHADRGQKAHGDFGACARCHDTKAWKPSSFDHGASTGFPITGQHQTLGCRDCHAEKVRGFPKGAKAERSTRTPVLASAGGVAPWMAALLVGDSKAPAHGSARDCAHCHADPHSSAGAAPKPCEGCHATTGWRPSSFDVARHAATPFPLRGKHEAVNCRGCHADAQLTGLPKDCAGCHMDRHRGKLGTDCAGCHDENGFQPVPSFDHAKTGFSLTGPHAAAGCARCHEGSRGEALARAEKAGACASCHPPGHGAELGSDCERCHPLAAEEGGRAVSFAAARGMSFFDHGKTAFPLDRRHRAQACKKCHPASGPPPTARCASCHADPHSGQLGVLCEQCHKADRWRLIRFDHNRAGWPLRGSHFVTPCASCHTAQRWVGLRADCFDCHALEAARARMRPDVGAIHAIGALDCRQCHGAWTWRR